MFSMGKRVSARELSQMLLPVKGEKSEAPSTALSLPRGIIADLISEEMMNFQSIEQHSAIESSPMVDGAAALVDSGANDDLDLDLMAPPPPSSLLAPPPPSSAMPPAPALAPEAELNDDLTGSLPEEAAIPAPTPVVETGSMRSPAPKRERNAGSLVAIFLILLVLGGSAAYYFTVMNQ